jgi:hypothetical protein
MTKKTLSTLNPFSDLVTEKRSRYFHSRFHGSQFSLFKRLAKNSYFSRNYIPGDPLSLVDWKAFARTDRLLVREKNEETFLKTSIYCCVTPRMEWPDEKTIAGLKQQISKKSAIALRIAFHLAVNHLLSFNKVSLYFCANAKELWKLDFDSIADLKDLFNVLLEQNFSFAVIKEKCSAVSSSLTVADLCYLVSDGVETQLESLLTAKSNNYIHVLSSLEKDIEWMIDSNCYFLNSSSRKEFIGSYLKENKFYQNKLDKWCVSLSERLKKKKCSYSQWTDMSLLSKYLGEVFNVYG